MKSIVTIVTIGTQTESGVQRFNQNLTKRFSKNVEEMEGMKETPLLFKGEMVRAILAGAKTQTRRLVKPQPVYQGRESEPVFAFGPLIHQARIWGQGGRIWIKETWRVFGGREYEYQRCKSAVQYRADEAGFQQREWRPAIFMPRWASRITLEIVSVRVERLQDISAEDAIAEGVPVDDPIHDYSKLWDSINGKKYPWTSNPWVWVIEFKKV